jgi:hypothetical protein
MKTRTTRAAALVIASIFSILTGALTRAADQPTTSPVKVIDDIVQPKRPIPAAIADAMQFLKKADGGYVPGKIDGELAGYFTSAFVEEDGSRSKRQMCFPARQHAYFIFTFLHYHAYTKENEWLVRARDLADWNLAHSTPAEAFYANVPYSVWTDGKPGGSGDKDAIEPDKDAWFGSAYLALFDATKDQKYLDGAKAIAKTLAARQNKDNSWPFRVVPEAGTVRQEFGGAPVFFVEFFEKILLYEKDGAYRRAYLRASQLMLQRNVEDNLWGTYHEDIKDKPHDYMSAEPMSFTANYLFRGGKDIPMGRKIIERMEARLVHTEGHPAAPAPAVSEQAGFEHMMPGHTARYCLALANLYAATGDEAVKRKALSGINALTYMQSDAGLFRTFFQLLHEKNPDKQRPNWYSQHLYTVCHVLEAMPLLPELKRE